MNPKHLVVAVACDPHDDRALAQHIVDEASGYAAALGARMTLVHVDTPWVPPVPGSFEAPAAVIDAMSGILRERRQAAAATLRALVLRAEARGVTTSPLAVATLGGVGEAIVNTARDAGADLIVLCSHGRRGAKRLLLGSVADRVVHLSPFPVLVLPPPHA